MTRSMRSLLVVACLAASAALAQDSEPRATPDVQELSRQATERARGVKITAKPVALTDEQKERVRLAAEGARNRSRTELSRLAKDHPFTPSPSSDTPASDNPFVEKPEQKLAGRVVIALSTSVPEATWKEYLAQVDGKREAIIVLRGFVGGAKTVMPTGKFIERMRRRVADNPKGGHRAVEVIVDPLVFSSLGIDKVPAISWLPDATDLAHCDGQVYDSAVTVFGNVSVGFALSEINRNGGSVPADIIKKFGGRT